MCTSPLIRAELYETYTNQKGGKSYKVEWLPRDIYDRTIGEKKLGNVAKMWSKKYRRITPIPCGQCIECQLQYASNWATRIMIEKEYGYHEKFDENGNPLDQLPYPDGTCWFITLTYANEYLKTHKTANTETGEVFEGTSLYKKDMQDFWKRLRKHYPQMKIKYFMCGEYGSEDYTLRPHYHAIVFGLPLEQEQFKKTGMSKKFNTPRWKLDKLTDIWGMGIVDIGRVTWNSAGYVARYTLKKATNGKNKEWYQAQGRIPEYVCMSQGIAKDYFEKNSKKIYQTDTVPITDRHGRIQKPPRSYDRMLKELDPKLYDEIKRKRTQNAEATEQGLRYQTNLNPEERRAIAEARMKAVIKDMRKEI